MAHRHHARQLFCGPLVEVTDFRCADDDLVFGGEETTTQTHVAFVRGGCFERQVEGRARLVDGHHVAFFNAGEPFRVRHPVPGGDRCTVFTLRTDALRAALANARPELADQQHPRFPWDQLPCPSEAFLLHAALVGHALAEHPDSLAPDALAVEELALRLVEALVAAAGEPPQAAPARADTARRHGELAEGARELLARRLAETLTLDEVAAALGCSPFRREARGSRLRELSKILEA
jgi:hypothetical protein